LKALDTPPKHASTRAGQPAAFLDRDGTLNIDTGYVHRIEDFTWVNGAQQAVRLLKDAGYLVFIVTNQSGVARGLYDCAAVDSLHRWLRAELAGAGAHIDDIRYCPHHPEGTVAAYAKSCACRKPAPGMLQQLIHTWQPDLARSFLLGDSQRDVQAGERAGVRGHLVRQGDILPAVQALLAGN